MGRKATTKAPEQLVSDFPAETPPDIRAGEAMIRRIEAAATSEIVQANRLDATLDMSYAMTKLLTCQQLVALSQLKESKGYRFLGADGQQFSTWEEYCISRGLSRQHIDEQIRNLHTFGEEALERLNRAGIGFRDLRKLRKLPDDEKEAVINGEAIHVGDKDEVIALIEDLCDKHTKEKEAAEKKISDLEATVEAKDQLLVSKDKKINSLDEKLKLNKKKTQEFDCRVNEYLIETTEIGGQIMTQIDRLNALRDTFLNDDFGEENETADKMMAENYYHVMQQIAKYMEETAAACEEVFSGYIE